MIGDELLLMGDDFGVKRIHLPLHRLLLRRIASGVFHAGAERIHLLRLAVDENQVLIKDFVVRRSGHRHAVDEIGFIGFHGKPLLPVHDHLEIGLVGHHEQIDAPRHQRIGFEHHTAAGAGLYRIDEVLLVAEVVRQEAHRILLQAVHGDVHAEGLLVLRLLCQAGKSGQAEKNR
jgi:hypothetical protein